MIVVMLGEHLLVGDPLFLFQRSTSRNEKKPACWNRHMANAALQRCLDKISRVPGRKWTGQMLRTMFAEFGIESGKSAEYAAIMNHNEATAKTIYANRAVRRRAEEFASNVEDTFFRPHGESSKSAGKRSSGHSGH